MFENIVKRLARIHISNAVNKALSDEVKRREMERMSTEEFTLCEFIGRKVIVISNEWEDPIFAFGIRIDYITKAKSPILVVKDIFTGEELMVFGAAMAADDQMVYAMLKLDPYERWNIRFPHAAVPWNKPRIGEITPQADLWMKLQNVGFVTYE